MYAFQQGIPVSAHRSLRTCLTAAVLIAGSIKLMAADDLQPTSVVCKISGATEKLELTTNTSRILTLDKNIPRVQVNNPDLLAVTPLSATQVQISAKKAGVTQVNLWDEDGKIHSVDVLIYGDARELEVALQTQFPHASIKVFRYSESLVLSGYVDRPDHVSPIMQLAQDYSPKVINNISVGGVQQILLKVRVMEVARNKLRQLSTDFAAFGSGGGFFSSAPSGLLQTIDSTTAKVTGASPRGGPPAIEFGIVHNNNAFFGFLDWLQQNQVAKILAEPNIVAVSGRPAQFQDGGEVPIPIPQSLGTTTIEFKPFGTIIDFLPIVLGNGNIRLEVRPQVVEADYSHAITVSGITIPAFNTRKVDTAVEMKAGQTFALAGLVQENTVTQKSGLPYVSDMPIIGVPFRKTSDTVEETEVLIVVTPEFVDPIDACDAPCGGPGFATTSPSNCGLYCAGHMEVPTACNPTQGLTACGQDPCANCRPGSAVGGGCGCNGCAGNNCGCNNGLGPVMNSGPANSMPPAGEMTVPMGADVPANATGAEPIIVTSPDKKDAALPEAMPPAPADISLPGNAASSDKAPKSAPQNSPSPLPKMAVPPQPSLPQPAAPQQPAAPKSSVPATPPATSPAPTGSSYYDPMTPNSTDDSAQAITPINSGSRPYALPRQPVFVRNASRPANPQIPQWRPATPPRENSLIGPVGYDVQQ